jgi:hypothetical protein
MTNYELSFLPNQKINQGNFFFRTLLLWVPTILLGTFMRDSYIEFKDLVIVAFFYTLLNYLLVIQFIKRLRCLNDNIWKSLISLIPIVSIIYWLVLSFRKSEGQAYLSKAEKFSNFLNIVYLSSFICAIGIVFKVFHYPGAIALIYYSFLCILIDSIVFAIGYLKDNRK